MTGKILWYDKRDRNGIIIGIDGNEYYFDSSVMSLPTEKRLHGTEVIFEVRTDILECLCATKVRKK